MAAIDDTTVETQAPPDALDRRARGVTARSVLLAFALLPLNAYWVTQMEVIRYEGHPTTVSLFYNCVFALALLVLLNALVARFAPRKALHRNELIVVYVVLAIGSSLAGHDTIQIIAPQIVCPWEGATPENKWADLFQPYLPRFLFLTDENLYGGAFTGSTSLYRWDRIAGWGKPVLIWTAFIVVLLFQMLCFNVILRSRWMDREKLTYPITHMPLEMTSERTQLFRNRYLWIGFGIAAAIDSVNGLHGFFPAVPEIKVRVVQYDAYMRDLFKGFPWGALAGTRLSFYPFAIGMGLLLPTDLAFSSWFFYLFWRVQHLVSALLGLNKIPSFPYVEEQSTAAYFGLCLFALWMGRDHVKQVFLHAFGAPGDLDDRREGMPYRWAVWGLLAGAAFMLIFSYYIRMSLWIAVVFFACYWMVSLAVTRVRAELGPPAHDLHRGGPDYVITNLFGMGSPIGAQNLTSMTQYFWFNRAYRAHTMPIQLEAYKLADQSGMALRPLTAVMMAAGVLGTLCAFWANIHGYYAYGMSAKMSFVGRYFGVEPYNRLQSWISAPQPANPSKAVAYLVGLAFTLGLMALRVRFVWWPFHPVGYAISSSWSMNCLWMPILIAWATKLLIMRYAGPKAFQRAIPLALGLILGEFIVGSLWCLLGIALQRSTYSFWV
ncbi:MAG: hypothetical protein FJX74_01230 [Armatimonadetes bacterium]|nr:hypothetical protein [Armatimonadota bacterium]